MDRQLREFKAQIFQALAHPTRIAIVEALCHGERTVGQLIAELGLEQANASQHFAVLRAKRVVAARKAGNQVYYSLRDPVLIDVLQILRRYFYSHLSEAVTMIEFMDAKEPAAAK